MPTVRVPIDTLMTLLSAAETALGQLEQVEPVSGKTERWRQAVATANSVLQAHVRP